MPIKQHLASSLADSGPSTSFSLRSTCSSAISDNLIAKALASALTLDYAIVALIWCAWPKVFVTVVIKV
ncbi:hypothetical protein SLA2020_025360 [Shorea laevis]